MPKLKLKAIMDNLDQMINFVLTGVEERDFVGKEEFKSKLHLACEEAMVNIIQYAYGDGVGDIEISYDFKEENLLVLKLIDSGVAFDPLGQEEPDLELSMDKRPIGSLGIYMVKNVMDDLDYERKEGKNILTLIKDLDQIA